MLTFQVVLHHQQLVGCAAPSRWQPNVNVLPSQQRLKLLILQQQQWQQQQQQQQRLSQCTALPAALNVLPCQQ
jgi:hypothetical protein